MAININTVIENLNELLTNSVNLTDKYYDLFINPEPMMIDLELYNEHNQLVTVTVPNRAKDREDINVTIPTHALKSYLDEGELLTDAEGLADILYYYHSTFDESKFTKVGTPTIIDGVAGNFSASNFITLTTNYTATTALKITFKFTTPASLSTNQPVVVLRNSDGYIDMWIYNGGLQLRAYTSANVNKQFTVAASTTYYAEIEYSGGTWTGRISTDGVNWTQQTLGTADILSPIVNTSIGRYVGITYEGTVDLKYFSIRTNNVPVFTGNKTGRDVVPVDGHSETIGYSYSKTGSKIADSYYRYRIKNIYKYYGYAPYYTVSDTDFTLPQGELYGIMENKVEEYSNWVDKYLTLAQNKAIPDLTQDSDDVYSLANYLPNDDYVYEVQIKGSCKTGSSINDNCVVSVDGGTGFVSICGCQTHTTSPAYAYGNGRILIYTNREIRVACAGGPTDFLTGTYSLTLLGYKRVGKILNFALVE